MSSARPRPTPAQFTGKASNWTQAVLEAQPLVQYEPTVKIDHRSLLGKNISEITPNINGLLNTKDKRLYDISKYYFEQPGKHIRPLLVLLISQATSLAPKNPASESYNTYEMMDTKLCSNNASWIRADDADFYHCTVDAEGCTILPTQRRLSEIVEMIHTTSLVHDDVVDDSPTRRGAPSTNATFGNRSAVLAGDFILARSSIALARLRNPEVTELLATVMEDLVDGELKQLKNTKQNDHERPELSTFEHYMEKPAAILGGSTKPVAELAYSFGKDLGLAFQLVDDMLDYTTSADEFGKPVGADLKLGLATAPVLFAWEEFPELGQLIKRKFSTKGDIEQAYDLVWRSNGIVQTRKLAESYCQKAINAVQQLPPSQAREALIQLAHKVVTRTK
ncbi:terpenoid synthase [Basidiobolus meristosporus CBS 931.73]|uniref:Terpenoid synthase n=1 Tax=Basidiobolus meristosporus CBS 931.73 TaxID=1314790 RepID=A0A1Y1XN62_9FUNG|nr:terpenoid synthase [Basidiobolus meristosporus CBS 931.73]|eukprot:ORX87171.1 terpenoid synthase [Basidiobolus meristosporus CBS 931.73]